MGEVWQLDLLQTWQQLRAAPWHSPKLVAELQGGDVRIPRINGVALGPRCDELMLYVLLSVAGTLSCHVHGRSAMNTQAMGCNAILGFLAGPKLEAGGGKGQGPL